MSVFDSRRNVNGARELSIEELEQVDGGIEFRGSDPPRFGTLHSGDGLHLLGQWSNLGHPSFEGGHLGAPLPFEPGAHGAPEAPTGHAHGHGNGNGNGNGNGGAFPGPHGNPDMPHGPGIPGGNQPTGGGPPFTNSTTSHGGTDGHVPGTVHTHSFAIKSWGDPHENITIDGHKLEQIDTRDGLTNFEVFNNTVGGPTSISTQTTNDPGPTYNREVDIHGSSWSMEVVSDPVNGLSTGMVVNIHDSHGTYTLTKGQPIHEADGTIISFEGDTVVVNQTLKDGGHVRTAIDDARGHLDLESTGEGDAGLSGWAADRYTENNSRR